MTMINQLPLERRAAHQMPAPVRSDVLGLRAAVDAVLQRWALALLSFLAVMALAVAYLLLTEPVYRANTLLEIEARPRGGLVPNLGGLERSAVDTDLTRASAEAEVLRSRDVLWPAILASGADIEVGMQRLWGLVPLGFRSGVDVPWFSVARAQRGKNFELVVDAGRWTLRDDDAREVAAGAVGQTLRFELGGEAAWILVKAPSELPGPVHLSLKAKSEQRALDDVADRLRIFEPGRESNILRISIEDTRPARAAILLNRQVANYLALTNERRHSASGRALQEFEEQLPVLQARMVEAEEALRAFQARTTAAPFVNKVDALLRQQADLERQRLDLGVKRDQLAQTLMPAHPDLSAVKAQLERVEREIGRITREVGRFPDQQQDAVRLQRDVQVATTVYTTLLNHVQQLRFNNARMFSGSRQLDLAQEPVEKLRPRGAATLAVGGGLGLLLALAAVVLARAFRPTVDHSLEFDLPAGAPVALSFVPEAAAQRRLAKGRLKTRTDLGEGTLHRVLVRAAPLDAAAQSLRAAYAGMRIRARQHAAPVLLVTSPSRGAGKTFVAANLAALMAEAGERVVLLEADFQGKGLNPYLGLEGKGLGLSELLAGKCTVDEVLQRPDGLGLDAILRGSLADHTGAALNSPAFEALVAELRTRYDRVVINAAPMLPAGDALIAGRVCDQALLVVRSERSLVHDTQVAQHRLAHAAIRLESILVNGVKRNRLSAPRQR